MSAALAADGVARNLPWRLARPKRVVARSGDVNGSQEGQGQGQGHHDLGNRDRDGYEDGDMRYPAVYPLQPGSGLVGFGKGEGEENEKEDGKEGEKEMETPALRDVGYTQFVITLADMAEGRRFARAWHRRELEDARTGRMMSVDAAMLW